MFVFQVLLALLLAGTAAIPMCSLHPLLNSHVNLCWQLSLYSVSLVFNPTS